jgi:hypothetical protein
VRARRCERGTEARRGITRRERIEVLAREGSALERKERRIDARVRGDLLMPAESSSSARVKNPACPWRTVITGSSVPAIRQS